MPAGVAACYINSGQTCSALTRMLVPRSRLAEVEALAVETAETYTPGDPFEGDTRLGPLVSATQLERVRGYIKKGVDEGATLLTGGAELPDGLDKGYFVRPTVFSNVTRDMTIAQEEIFGPVLSIIPYDTEEEAIEIANDTVYGLAGGVWAGDKEHAERVARRLRSRPGRGQRGRVQPPGAVRRLQAVRHRPRARQVRPRGVPGGQGAPALTARRHAPHGARGAGRAQNSLTDTRFCRARRRVRTPSSSILVIDSEGGPRSNWGAGGRARSRRRGTVDTEKVFRRRVPLVPIVLATAMVVVVAYLGAVAGPAAARPRPIPRRRPRGGHLSAVGDHLVLARGCRQRDGRTARRG